MRKKSTRESPTATKPLPPSWNVLPGTSGPTAPWSWNADGTIPPRTKSILKLVLFIARSPVSTAATLDLIPEIVTGCIGPNNRPSYSDELLPAYKTALEKLAIKAKLNKQLDLQQK